MEDENVRDDAEEFDDEVASAAEDAPRMNMQPLIDNLRERMARAEADLALPAHTTAFAEDMSVPHEPLIRPPGDAAQLLEHQLASSAALIAYIAHFVARPDTSSGVCMSFMDNMSSLLGASAGIGKVVGRLRGQVSESRQTITVEKKLTGGRGEGVPES